MQMKIKKIIPVIVGVVLCLGFFSQFANADILEEVFKRMAYVDLQKVFQEYHKKQDLEAKLRAEGEAKRQQLQEKKQELVKLQQEYEAQKLLLTEEAKKKREQEINLKSQELKSFLDKISNEMKQRESQYTHEIVSDIKNKIKQIAKREGYRFVFDSAAILYAAPMQDLTQKVIDELNKEYDKAKKKETGKNE